MDQKRTQRIMGIIIVIALVIVLFPLLFSKNESTPTIATIKTPPFPEPVTTASTSSDTLAVPEVAKDNTLAPETKADTQVHEPESVKMEQTTQLQSAPTNATNDVAVPGQADAELPPPPVLTSEETLLPEKALSPHETKSIKRAVLIQTQKKSSHKNHLANPLTYNKAAWVVQMGSFKDKNNARRLTDRLRAAGFAAFTREVEAKKGTQMRVYVGPEFKQFAAVKLSSKIEHEMNLHGIVIPYNPLRL